MNVYLACLKNDTHVLTAFPSSPQTLAYFKCVNKIVKGF